MKFYESDFAPCAATRRDVIRVAQLVHDEKGSAYEAFAPGAFAGWGQSDIPVCIDHDVTTRAGTVTAVAAFGDWWRGSFMLDGPDAGKAEEIIERGGKVSPSFEPLEKDPDFATPISLAHLPTHWYTRARLTEISIASPGAIPWSGCKGHALLSVESPGSGPVTPAGTSRTRNRGRSHLRGRETPHPPQHRNGSKRPMTGPFRATARPEPPTSPFPLRGAGMSYRAMCEECKGEIPYVRDGKTSVQFCSPKCRYKARDRARYAADPEGQRARRVRTTGRTGKRCWRRPLRSVAPYGRRVRSVRGR